MIALAYFVVVGFAVLTVIYVSLSLYSRAVRRGKLEAKWEAGPRKLDRETYIERGLERYDNSIRRKLILGVYIIPVVVVATIIYLVNHA